MTPSGGQGVAVIRQTMKIMRQRMIVTTVMFLAAIGCFASGASEERYFSSIGVDSISVNAQFLDVEVTADDGFSVSMVVDPPEDSLFGRSGVKVMHERVGSRLTVWVVKDNPFFGSVHGGKISLQVPRETSISVESVSGRIVVRGVKSPDLALKTVSGGLLLQDVQGDVDASTVSGDIALQTTQGGIRAKTVSGSIKGDGVDFSRDSAFSSVSGTIDIRLATPLDALSFDLSSISGRIVVGTIRAARGLRIGFGGTSVEGKTVSGGLIFR